MKIILESEDGVKDHLLSIEEISGSTDYLHPDNDYRVRIVFNEGYKEKTMYEDTEKTKTAPVSMTKHVTFP